MKLRFQFLLLAAAVIFTLARPARADSLIDVISNGVLILQLDVTTLSAVETPAVIVDGVAFTFVSNPSQWTAGDAAAPNGYANFTWTDAFGDVLQLGDDDYYDAAQSLNPNPMYFPALGSYNDSYSHMLSSITCSETSGPCEGQGFSFGWAGDVEVTAVPAAP